MVGCSEPALESCACVAEDGEPADGAASGAASAAASGAASGAASFSTKSFVAASGAASGAQATAPTPPTPTCGTLGRPPPGTRRAATRAV
jgi:hypothetical protein